MVISAGKYKHCRTWNDKDSLDFPTAAVFALPFCHQPPTGVAPGQPDAVVSHRDLELSDGSDGLLCICKAFISAVLAAMKAFLLMQTNFGGWSVVSVGQSAV